MAKLNWHVDVLSFSLVSMIPIFSLVILSLVSFLVWQIIFYARWISPFRKLPQPKSKFLSVSHGKYSYVEPSSRAIEQWIETIPNDGLIRYLGCMNFERLLVTSPEGINEVLVRNSYDYVKPIFARKLLARVLGGVGMLLAEGEEHRLQRKTLMPAFAFRYIKSLYPLFWSKSCELVSTIEQHASDGQCVDMMDWSMRATLDIIGSAAMAQEFRAIANPDSELSRNYRNVATADRAVLFLNLLNIFLPDWFIRWLPFKSNVVFEKSCQYIRNTSRTSIQKMRLQVEKAPGDSETKLDLLSTAIGSYAFTESSLVDQFMSFLAGGHESTATSLTWAIYLLCQHPATQIRLRHEIRTNLPSPRDTYSTIDANTIDKLPYLHAVCQEALRLHPAFPLMYRTATTDTVITGVKIPKGTNITIAPFATNQSPALWGPDAKAFNPERWLGGNRSNTGGATSNLAFSSFSHGARTCPGMGFAKGEMKCLLAALVGQFEMALRDEGKQVRMTGWAARRPVGGMPIRIRTVDGW